MTDACGMSVMVMAKPTLHLANLSGLTPTERVRVLAKLLEQLTGRKPAPEEVENALQTATATESSSRAKSS